MAEPAGRGTRRLPACDVRATLVGRTDLSRDGRSAVTGGQEAAAAAVV